MRSRLPMFAAFLLTLGLANGFAQTAAPAPAAPGQPAAAKPAAPAANPGAPGVPAFRPYKYSYTMVQLHAFPDYQPLDTDVFKLMFERIGTFDYGDDYFFLGINSDYQEDYSSNTETLYFKYAPCLSLDKVFGTEIVPLEKIGDTFLTLQVNAGDLEYLRTVWLAGVAFDLAGMPNYGRWRLYVMARQEDTMRMTHQVTLMWAQPFYVAGHRFIFNGWGAHWDNDDTRDVMKFEPQLRYCLSNVLSEGNFFHNMHIGAEAEFSHHYLFDPVTHELRNWDVNPSVFVAWEF